MKKSSIPLVVILASLIIIIAGIMSAKSIILPIMLALFISIICTQPILWLERKKVPYGIAMLIILGIAGIIFTFLGGLIGNSLARFAKDAPKYEQSLRQLFSSTIENLGVIGVELDSSQLTDTLDPGKILSFTAGAVGEVGGVMSDSFLIMFITVFMLLEVKTFLYKATLVEKMYGNSLKYFDKIGASIRHYLSIKTVVSIATGVFIWLWLLVLGVDYAILWGVIAFLLNYIPSIGSIIAAVPTVLLALIQLGVGGMIWTAVGYLLVNTVMGNVIEPKIMGKGLGLSTLVVFLSLIVWGFILGSVGMFLSIPLTISIKIMLEQNEETKWIAVLLGAKDEAKKSLKEI